MHRVQVLKLLLSAYKTNTCITKTGTIEVFYIKKSSSHATCMVQVVNAQSTSQLSMINVYFSGEKITPREKGGAFSRQRVGDKL